MCVAIKSLLGKFCSTSSFIGVCFISLDLVMTTSIDQRLNTWRISREAGIWLVSSVTHDVADTTSLAAYKTRYECVGETKVLVFHSADKVRW